MIRAQIYDQYDVEGVFLLYRLDQDDWQATAMTETVPGEYTATLGDFAHGGTATYLVTARNSLGGWAASTAGALGVNDCHMPTVGAPTETADPIYAPPCDASGITIEADLTDATGIAGGWLVYRDTSDPRNPWQSVALQRIPESDRWGASLGPFDAPALYAYAIHARNVVGGAAWSTAATFQVLPCDRPTFNAVDTSDVPIFASPCHPYTLTVYADIGSAQGVSGAWIGYRQLDGPRTRWRFATMGQSQQPGWYEGHIGPFGDAMTLEYLLGARSGTGGWAWTQPDELEVLACERPVIEKVSASAATIRTPPCLPETAIITAQVSDPLGIAEIALRYRDRTEETWLALPMTETGTPGAYDVTLGPFEKPGLKDYHVMVVNEADVWSASSMGTLQVDECGGAAYESTRRPDLPLGVRSRPRTH